MSHHGNLDPSKLVPKSEPLHEVPSEAKVLVIFQATEPRTEALALSAGLGVVQTGGFIRLRHLASITPATLEHQGYGLLKEADLAWAEGILIGVESETPIAELEALALELKRAHIAGSLAGTVAWVFGPEGASGDQCPSVAWLNETLAALGVSILEMDIAAGRGDSDATTYLNHAGRIISRAATKKGNRP